MKEDTKIFTAGVRSLVRSDRNTNQTEIAGKLDIPLSTFNGWMNGHRNMPPKYIEKFIQYFGKTTEEIMDVGRQELGIEPGNHNKELDMMRDRVADLEKRLESKECVIKDYERMFQIQKMRIEELECFLKGEKKNAV